MGRSGDTYTTSGSFDSPRTRDAGSVTKSPLTGPRCCFTSPPCDTTMSLCLGAGGTLNCTITSIASAECRPFNSGDSLRSSAHAGAPRTRRMRSSFFIVFIGTFPRQQPVPQNRYSNAGSKGRIRKLLMRGGKLRTSQRLMRHFDYSPWRVRHFVPEIERRLDVIMPGIDFFQTGLAQIFAVYSP